MTFPSKTPSPKEILLFELVERTARLLSHVQLSRQIASRHSTRSGAQDEAAKSIEQLLKDSFETLRVAACQPADRDDTTIIGLNEIKDTLDGLHVYLLQYIPRPFEPVELLSFIRQSLAETKFSDQCPVFASEQLFNSCYESDPVDQLSRRLKKLATQLKDPSIDDIVARTDELEHPSSQGHAKAPGYISIPRVDLNNPCSWPSLIHEVNHQYGEESSDGLKDQLKARLGPEAYASLLNSCRVWMSPYEVTDDELELYLGHWLLECWCDCAGIRVLGPSIWFSQLYAFLYTLNRYLGNQKPSKVDGRISYPPPYFRLKVLRTVLKNRYEIEDEKVREQIVKLADETQKALLSIYCPALQSSGAPEVAHVYTIFSDFLSSKLPGGTEKLSESISFADMEKLVDALNAGEPIPTVGIDPLSDRHASIGEILLAGWISRLGVHREKVLRHLTADISCDGSSMKKLQRIVDRFDECLKRSIQVAEWVRLLRSNNVQDVSLNEILHSRQACDAHQSLLLSKIEIIENLKSNELRIVPLINADLQISQTSVDVRLGHNFEVFFPDTRGVIDAVAGFRDESNISPESMDVQIDFSEGISIHPGQFVLAHTLEYIRLPSNIAAQIEGRSSFARLGLQVHMTANLVEAGFEGSLTLEIANVGPTAIKLYPGTRIGQLRFFAINDAMPSSKEAVPKYHGLLSQNKTRQNVDPEVNILREHRSQVKTRGGNV